MNNDDVIAALLATAMNNANNIVTCKIEAAINLSEKQEAYNNHNKSIIIVLMLTYYLLTYSLVLSDTGSKSCKVLASTSCAIKAQTL